MRKRGLVCTCLILFTCSAFCSPYVSIFDGYGKVTVTETSSGIRTDTNFQLEPKQKYMIKYLSSCQIISSYRTQFRHSFEIIKTSDKNGRIQHSSSFSGFHVADLKSRNLNTIALYRLEKSHWKMLKCVALSDSQTNLIDTGIDKQQP